MVIQLRAFSIALATVLTLLILVISIWARVSPDFGRAFLAAYNSVHPHPFVFSDPGLGVLEHIYGVAIDVVYAAVDSVIFALGFGSLYNRLVVSGASGSTQIEEER